MAGQLGSQRVTTRSTSRSSRPTPSVDLLLVRVGGTGQPPAPSCSSGERGQSRRRSLMALTVPLRTVDGGSAGSVNLDEAVFGHPAQRGRVMHQVVTAQLAARRSGTQSTKTRAEVSGGGRKPFSSRRGRAGPGRVQDPRAPLGRRGRGPLGPKPRLRTGRRPRRRWCAGAALSAVGSGVGRAGGGDRPGGLPWTQPKTATDAKAALAALRSRGQGPDRARPRNATTTPTRSFRERAVGNLPDVQLLLAGELNAYDVLCNDWVVFGRAQPSRDRLRSDRIRRLRDGRGRRDRRSRGCG